MSLPVINFVYVIISILMTIAILFGNLLTITAVLRFSHLQTATNKLLVNLAVSDCIVGLIMPLRGAFFLEPALDTQKWACVMSVVLLQLSCASSICNMMFIAIDRYVFISFPLRYPNIVTSRRCALVIIVTWTYAVLFSTSLIYWNNWTQRSPGQDCNLAQLSSSNYVYFFNVTQFCIMVMVMLTAYGLIWKQAYKHNRQISAQMAQSINGQNRSRDMKFIKTLLIVLGLFIISWSPYVLLLFTSSIDETLYNKEAYNITFFLGIFNSTMNPFVYGWRNTEYRRAYKILLHLQKPLN